MLATIWSDVEKIQKQNEKPTITMKQKKVYWHQCVECGHEKQFCDGLPVCTNCGLVESTYVCDTPEWTSGAQDGIAKDPARCGNPNANPELYAQNWGKSTTIGTSRVASYKNKRMAKIAFHMSMNHKDRSLFHVYRDIDEACPTIQDTVLRDAKILYRKFNSVKLTRGAVRTGIKANAVLMACRMSSNPRTPEEIADMFKIKVKDISRTTQMFRDALKDTLKKEAPPQEALVTRPSDLVCRMLNDFEVSRQERIRCVNVSRSVEDCVALMSKTPKCIATACIYYVLKDRLSKQDVCGVCKISVPTLNKIEPVISKHLETVN